MGFEWGHHKNLSNITKHGIDFEAAKNLWLDENRVEIWAPTQLKIGGLSSVNVKKNHGRQYLLCEGMRFASSP